MKRHLNAWHKDRPDHRDIRLAHLSADAVPDSDLRAKCPWIKDQGQIGSCTAFATTFVWWFEECQLDGNVPESVSELRAYYWTRFFQGTVNQDSGGTLRGAMKAIAAKGLCHEHLWPYMPAQFKKKPSQAAEKDGLAHLPTGKMYAGVSQDAQSLRHVLSQGRPIACGFSVPQSFMTQQMAQTGIYPGPMQNEPVVGGHAVAIVGYNSATGRYILRNSWGTGWGQAGYFEMPGAMVEDPNWFSDFWCVIGGPSYT